jgi:regulator of sirC expression with transglutaminase-like and TPR domain
MRVIVILSLLLFGISCKQNGPLDNSSRIEILEAQLRSKESMDTTLGDALIVEYDAFVAGFPKDSMSAVYLFKKAEVLKASPGRSLEATLAFQEVYKSYAYHANAPKAMLAMALYYEEMRSQDLAASTYQLFIDKYPSHPLANNARQLLDLLNNTEEMEIQMVQKWKDESQNAEKIETK